MREEEATVLSLKGELQIKEAGRDTAEEQAKYHRQESEKKQRELQAAQADLKLQQDAASVAKETADKARRELEEEQKKVRELSATGERLRQHITTLESQVTTNKADA